VAQDRECESELGYGPLVTSFRQKRANVLKFSTIRVIFVATSDRDVTKAHPVLLDDQDGALTE